MTNAIELLLFLLLLVGLVRVAQAELHHRELSRLLECILEGDDDD